MKHMRGSLVTLFHGRCASQAVSPHHPLREHSSLGDLVLSDYTTTSRWQGCTGAAMPDADMAPPHTHRSPQPKSRDTTPVPAFFATLCAREGMVM